MFDNYFNQEYIQYIPYFTENDNDNGIVPFGNDSVPFIRGSIYRFFKKKNDWAVCKRSCA